MKEFGTRLPPLPRGELIILLGETAKRLASGWSVSFDPMRASTGVHPLEVRAQRAVSSGGRNSQMSLTCQMLPFPTGEFEMRVTFEEGSESRESEAAVGAAMAAIHAGLCWLLGEPPGTPPAPNMWGLNRGRWQFGPQFQG